MIMIVISVSMVLLEVHKMFYDEEEERRKKAEQYEDHREKFLEHLNGTSVGGNTL